MKRTLLAARNRMKPPVLVAIAVVVLAYGISHGQDVPRNDNLRFFDAHVGTWIKEGVLEEDMPFGKKGDVGTSSLTWRWSYNKNAIDWRWEFDYAGKRSGTKGVIAWDPGQKTMVGAGVSSDGGIIRGTSRSMDPMTILVQFIQPDGSARSHVETFSLKDDDTMTIKITERKGSDATEDSPEYVFKRVRQPRPAKGAIPRKVLRELRFMVGEWKSETSTNGEKTGTAHHTRRWAPGRHGLIMTWQATENGAPVNALGISGWNAKNAEVLEHWYDSLGRYGTVRYPLNKITTDAWEGTAHRVYPDGTTSEGKCRLEKGDGRWVFTIVGEENGKPLTVRNHTRKVR